MREWHLLNHIIASPPMGHQLLLVQFWIMIKQPEKEKKHESREKNQVRKSNFLLSIITFSPSAVQSEIGHPWSAVEKGQAPFEMWRYHLLRSPGQSSKTFQTRKFLINKGKSMWFIMINAKEHLGVLNIGMGFSYSWTKFFNEVSWNNSLDSKSSIP